MKVAYLLSQYPTIGHTYLLRELRGLRELGWDIPTVSIRRPDRQPGEMLEIEREEAAGTFYVLQGGLAAFALDHLAVLASRPMHYLKGLLYAFSLGGPDLKKCLYSLIYFAEGVRAGRWMMRHGVTHFHSHFSTTVGLLILKVFPLTMSATIHGPEEFVDPAGFYLKQKIQASRFVCAISFFGRSQLAQLVSWEMWDRLEVARLGIDPSVYEPGPFRESPGTYEIVCVGRLTPFKGQHVLLECVRRLIAQGRDVHLRLIGDGPDRGGLVARIRELGLVDRVTVEGWMNQDEVREMYRRADIFALASFAEGVPVVLMEAMAMELPCVATRVTGVPELIQDGIDGLLVTPSDPEELADAIARLIDEPALRRRLAEAGRRRVCGRYNLAANVARLADIFRRRLSS
jgi:colanic acid/amylovoran biosynthesis glycosyltransferase